MVSCRTCKADRRTVHNRAIVIYVLPTQLVNKRAVRQSRCEIGAVAALVSTVWCFAQRRTNTRDAFIKIVVDLWAEESEDLPALDLKLVRLARIVDALAQRGMEFQPVGVYQDALRGRICEVRSCDQATS